MANRPAPIVWTKSALSELRKANDYISNDSPQNALKVINDILEAVEKAAVHQDIYPSDKFKRNNDGTFRAFEIHRYRVSYRISENILRVLRFRRISRNPKMY